MKPVCPQCGSKNVVASLAKNSHDNCVACGYSDFVVYFYSEVAEPGDKVQTNGNSGEPWLQSAEADRARYTKDYKGPRFTAKAEDVLRQSRKPYWWED